MQKSNPDLQSILHVKTLFPLKGKLPDPLLSLLLLKLRYQLMAPSPFAQGHSERLLSALQWHVQRLLQLCKGSLVAFLI